MMQGPASTASSDRPSQTVVDDTVSVPGPLPTGTNGTTRVVGQPVARPASATLKLYAGEWAGFVRWCRQHRRTPLPACGGTLAAYLLAAAPTLSRGALGRRRAAIGAMHRQAGLAVPRLDAASRKALRATAKPPKPPTSTALATPAALARLAARCPRDLAGLRDRALLLLVAATQRPARRRADAVPSGTEPQNGVTGGSGTAGVPRLVLLALDAEDVRFTDTGAALQLRTRMEEPAPTRTLTLARAPTASTCAVRALEDWLRRSDTTFGPVFRKVDRWGNVEHARLGADAWRVILARRGGTVRPRARA